MQEFPNKHQQVAYYELRNRDHPKGYCPPTNEGVNYMGNQNQYQDRQAPYQGLEKKKSNEKKTKAQKVQEEKGKLKSFPVQHPPYPNAPTKKENLRHYARVLNIFSRLQINIPLSEVPEQMPMYAKFMKDILTKKKRLGNIEVKHTKITLQLADKSITRPSGIDEDVLVKMDKLLFTIDFVVMDIEEDDEHL
ncbi:uncharacterized protein LOC127086910 [Lathyrus oleraceus]|uniref:uncharacterized protein LOC127086910 n=1 Tax=Pisum sativum TaxID=3888 RepID=UPI0021D2F962|nr:uncharacterized protein LOC127086910 [Pisum sativum]